jgi:hypothetical protein
MLSFRGSRRVATAVLLMTLAALGWGPVAAARADDGSGDALAWLAARQDAGGGTGLVRSFTIPAGDPDRALSPLSFTYDDGLAALAFLAGGETTRAHDVLAGLASIQAPDGSLPFAYDTTAHVVASELRRSGAIAWAGYAAVRYEQATGDRAFRAFAEGVGDWLIDHQVTATNGFASTDQRYGSVLGGPDVEWASTEHNVDAYFFLRDLGRLPSAGEQYAPAANAIADSLVFHHWDYWRGRFFTGVTTSWPDPTRALDVSSWGGLFMLAIGRADLAAQAAATLSDFDVTGKPVVASTDLDRYNTTYSSLGPFAGYRGYAGDPGTDDPPDHVWAEGTWGALLLRARLGEDVSADVASLQALQDVDPAGGYLQVTEGRRSPPYENHVWPATAPTAWAVMVLRDRGGLWGP